MEYLFIYGLQVADIVEIVATVTLVLGIASIIFLVTYWVENYNYISDKESTDYETFNLLKKVTASLCLTTLFLGILPTKQTMLLVGGTYLGKKAVNQVAMSDKMEKINTIIDLQLDKYIKELKENDNERNKNNIRRF